MVGSSNNPPMATIITDASHNNIVYMGSWAGRVIFDGKRMTYGGVLNGRVESSQDAEMAAIINTIHRGLCEEIIPVGAGWYVQSDNTHAVQVYNHLFGNRSFRSWPATLPKLNRYQYRLIGHMETLVSEVKPAFVHVRHVKGHVKFSNRDRKHHVHSDLDNLARNSLRDHLRALATDVHDHGCPACGVSKGHCIDTAGHRRETHFARICNRVSELAQ